MQRIKQWIETIQIAIDSPSLQHAEVVDNGTRSSRSTHVKLIPHSSGSTVSEQLIPNPGNNTVTNWIFPRPYCIFRNSHQNQFVTWVEFVRMPDHLNSQFMMRAQRRGRAFHGVVYRMQFNFKEFRKGAHLFNFLTSNIFFVMITSHILIQY